MAHGGYLGGRGQRRKEVDKAAERRGVCRTEERSIFRAESAKLASELFRRGEKNTFSRSDQKSGGFNCQRDYNCFWLNMFMALYWMAFCVLSIPLFF